MSYTKGEWNLDILTGDVQANGIRIAKVYGATEFNHENDSAECMANARLILKAPAMLNALRKAVSALAMCRYCETLTEEIQELIDNVGES